MSRPAMWPTQPPVQWARRFFLEINDLGMRLTTQFQLVLKLRMSGDIPLLPLYVFMVLTGTNVQATEMICSVYLQIDGKL